VPTTHVPVPLSRRLRDVRGSAIRDLLTLTARDDVLSLAGGLPAADLLPRERIAVAADRALSSPRPFSTARRRASPGSATSSPPTRPHASNAPSRPRTWS
jgi:DNA-binding transcriptional MocR family regulator